MRSLHCLCLVLLVGIVYGARRSARRSGSAHDQLMTTFAPSVVYPWPGASFAMDGFGSGTLVGDTCTAEAAWETNMKASVASDPQHGIPSHPTHFGGGDGFESGFYGPQYVTFNFTLSEPKSMYISTCNSCPYSGLAGVPAMELTEFWIQGLDSGVNDHVTPWTNNLVDTKCDSSVFCGSGARWAAHTGNDETQPEFSQPSEGGCGWADSDWATPEELPAGNYALFVAYADVYGDCVGFFDGYLSGADTIDPARVSCQRVDQDTGLDFFSTLTSVWPTQTFGFIDLDLIPSYKHCGPFQLSYSFESPQAARQQRGCSGSGPGLKSGCDSLGSGDDDLAKQAWCNAHYDA